MENTDRIYHFKNDISAKLKTVGSKFYFLRGVFTLNDCVNICFLFLCFCFFIYFCLFVYKYIWKSDYSNGILYAYLPLKIKCN